MVNNKGPWAQRYVSVPTNQEVVGLSLVGDIFEIV